MYVLLICLLQQYHGWTVCRGAAQLQIAMGDDDNPRPSQFMSMSHHSLNFSNVQHFTEANDTK